MTLVGGLARRSAENSTKAVNAVALSLDSALRAAFTRLNSNPTQIAGVPASDRVDVSHPTAVEIGPLRRLPALWRSRGTADSRRAQLGFGIDTGVGGAVADASARGWRLADKGR